MPNVEPHRLSATDLARLIEGGELTAEAVVASCLARIAEREPVVRAWSYLAAETALARARALDKAGKKTLLKGVPFGLKDIFDAAGMPTTYGSPIYAGWRPANDASAAALPKFPRSSQGSSSCSSSKRVPMGKRDTFLADGKRT